MTFRIFTTLALLSATAASGQSSLNRYAPIGHIAVEKGAATLSAPFAGGINTPQFAQADLNRDGKPDLVLFEGYGRLGVRTFINYGVAGMPDYRYEPQYEQAFPDIVSYLILKDYNGDGIADLFHAGLGGFNFSKGYYANGLLRFQFVRELNYMSGNQPTNAYVSGGDIPGIEDIDGDGDLDFLSYSIDGGRILWYKNLQRERGLPRDSVYLIVETGCWGRTRQYVERTVVVGVPTDSCKRSYIWNPSGGNNGSAGQQTPSLPAKTTMHGSNALCLLDIDGDGDFDYLNGNGAYNDIQLLVNGRIEWGRQQSDSIVAQDTLWQKNGIRYQQSNFPAAFYIDYNNDGKKDIVIAPHGSGSRNNNQVWLYQNKGTANTPRFEFTSDSLLSDQLIDAGRRSRPLFYDFNKDGKPDLLVGGRERLGNGKEVSRLHYYENITTVVGSPRFRYHTSDLVGLANQPAYATDPAVGDVDGDGLDDLIIGRADGKMLYYRNSAPSASVPPLWTLQEASMTRDGSTLMNVWAEASPAFYDVNKDGKPDLLIGQQDGRLTVYLNTNTTSGQVSFGPPMDSFGRARVPDWDTAHGRKPSEFRYSRPFVGKLQAGSNKDYLLMGGAFGRLYVWDSVGTGNLNQVFPMIADTFSRISLPEYTAPAVADVDGDGKLELVVGNELGGLFLFWTGKGQDTDNRHLPAATIAVFPNPTSGDFTLSRGSGGKTASAVMMADVTGRVVYRGDWPAGQPTLVVPADGLSNGVYLLSVTGEEGRMVQKVQVLR